MSDGEVSILQLSKEAIFEVPRRVCWQKAFIHGNCQLVIPNPDALNQTGLEDIYHAGFSDTDESLEKYFKQNSDLLQPIYSYCYLLPKLKQSAKDAQAILFNATSACVVVKLHGESVLGLNAGGMDHSWDICMAYIRLGYLPPFHFCKLPDIESLKNKVVKEAALYTCDAVMKKSLSTFNHVLDL